MNTKTKKLLAPALLLSLMAVAFRFDDGGITWFWTGAPQVAGFLLAGAAVCWVLLLVSLRGHRPAA